MKPQILSIVKWGKPVLSLISHFDDLERDYPTAILLRHSERYYNKDLSQEGMDDLTPRGEEAAFELGTMFPTNYKYRMYSSPSPRCRNTSKKIQAGILKNGGNAELNGILPYIREFHIDINQLSKYTKRDGRKYLIRWVSGFYPPEAMTPSIEVAMKTLKDIKGKLATADSKTIDIHISHDIYVAGTIFHLIGSLDPNYPVNYMDGLLLQIVGDQIVIYHKNGVEMVYPPCWWDKLSQIN
jgi:hypothetical protein